DRVARVPRAASRLHRRRRLLSRGSTLHRAQVVFYFRPRRNLRWAVLSREPAWLVWSSRSSTRATGASDEGAVGGGTLVCRRASMTRCCTMLSAELVNMYRHNPAGKKSMKLVIIVGIIYSIIFA